MFFIPQGHWWFTEAFGGQDGTLSCGQCAGHARISASGLGGSGGTCSLTLLNCYQLVCSVQQRVVVFHAPRDFFWAVSRKYCLFCHPFSSISF